MEGIEGCSHHTFNPHILSTVKAAKKFSYLTNHDGERKDANKVIDELEADLKDGGGVWQAADSDQCLHRKVIAADVAKEAQVNSLSTLVMSSTGLLAIRCTADHSRNGAF